MKYKGKITDDLDLVHGKWSKANLIQKCSAIPTTADVAVGQPFMWVGATTDYGSTTGFFTYGAYYKMTDGTPAIVKISSSGGGAEYTAGDDIKISSDNKISVDRDTLLMDTHLIGSPTAPTAITSTRTSVIANTLFVHELVDEKQDISDNSLETDVKTIVGAINEVNSKIPHLYQHSASYFTSEGIPNFTVVILSTSETAFTHVSLCQWLIDNGYTTMEKCYRLTIGVPAAKTCYVATSSGGSPTTQISAVTNVATGAYAENTTTLYQKSRNSSTTTWAASEFLNDQVLKIF